jgi:hypothetical protein
MTQSNIKAIPEGMHIIAPHLIVRDAAEGKRTCASPSCPSSKIGIR